VRWADKHEVRRAVGDEAVCTLNALTAPVHAGTAELHYGRKGHIQGSVNVPYPSLLNSDGTYLPAAELRAGADAHGPRQRGGVRRLDVGMGARSGAADGSRPLLVIGCQEAAQPSISVRTCAAVPLARPSRL
jgi:hypothetical protein